MRFSFRDRYRLLGRAIRVAFNPKVSEATFMWREANSEKVLPHSFFTPDKSSVALCLDFFAEVISRRDSVEAVNKTAANLLLKAAAKYCDDNNLDRDTLVVYAKPLLLKADLEAVNKAPTFEAKFLNE